MLRIVVATSPIFLAASLVAGTAGAQQASPAGAQQPVPPQVTVVGCVARNGDVDVNRGTRTLDLEAGALALTAARIVDGNRNGGVPGAPRPDTDSGTIPQRTIVGNQPATPDTTAFALIGAKSTDLESLVGRRVEIVGRITSAVPRGDDRGTTGNQRGAAPVAGAGTREERPDERTAHPSAELRRLEVMSYKGITGSCE
jgi:hypothetical protein